MLLKVLKEKLSGLLSAVVRYPVTVLFLTASAVLTAVSISSNNELNRYILTGIIGAMSSAACQAVYERYFSGGIKRVVLYLAAILLTVLFFLSIYSLKQQGVEMVLRFAVSIFTLLIAFIWFAVVRGPRDFSESFLAAFKALFESAFFTGVLFLGCVLIIAAIDRLIIPVEEEGFAHTANIIFMVIAPIVFLSLIPVYPGKSTDGQLTPTQEAVLDRRTGCPKFLEVLLSYIIIPLTGIFTVILLVYIILNISGDFWTNNLLEPMLVAYTITVIVVTILVDRLKNTIAVFFIKVFPKVLIPIALFQVVASALLLRETGLTFGRYFVLLYGAFAVFAGVALSIKHKNKTGIIAPVLIVLSLLSMIPPVDAFTVSLTSQIYTLEQTLTKNEMLINDAIVPNGDIADTDKTKIINTVQYLSNMDELDKVDWLPDGFEVYNDTDFTKTFGFSQYEIPMREDRYVSVYYDRSEVLDISGFDVLTEIEIYDRDGWTGEKSFSVGSNSYELSVEYTDDAESLVIADVTGAELGRFDTSEIFSRYASFSSDKSALTSDEAIFLVENDALALKIIVLNAGFTSATDDDDRYAQLLVFVKIK